MSKKKRRKTGMSPGTLVYTGEHKDINPNVTVIRYNETIIEDSLLQGRECMPATDGMITWYDVRGLHDVELIETIGKIFNIHPLALEDVLDVQQRPKMDAYDGGIFMIVRSLTFDEVTLSVKTEQISFYITHNAVLTFQEDEEDLFPNIRMRLHTTQGRMRKRGTDYLTYALIDSIVDHYYLVLDKIEDLIETLEARAIVDAQPTDKGLIHRLKREMLLIRKSVVPMREVMSRFSKNELDLVHPGTEVFIRDLYDHIVQIIDTIESYRDMLNSLHDLYLSEISLKMNNIMQVLTVISTVFIPLTFLVGVYGMNFDVLPELHWRFGYFLLWGFMIATALGLLYYFKRRRWL